MTFCHITVVDSLLHQHTWSHARGVLQKICACWSSKFWLLLYLILSTFTTYQYTNFVQKTLNLAEIRCFLPSFAKNTHNLCTLGAFICGETPNRYTEICEKAPQKAGTYMYTMSMWVPPRPLHSREVVQMGRMPMWMIWVSAQVSVFCLCY